VPPPLRIVRHDAAVRSPGAPFLLRVGVREDRLSDYFGDVPAVRALVGRPLTLHPHVTLFVGENGSGKSTLVEAIAVASHFNPEGGGRLRFDTRPSHSRLHHAVVLDRAEVPPVNGFFLRAECFFNLATKAEATSGAWAMENVYEETEQFQLTRSFLDDRHRFLHYLLADDEEPDGG
jgi:predicted ATPase